MTSKEEQKLKTLDIIKSCLVSAKDPLSSHQLLRDYKDLVGQAIPFESYGYRKFTDFLLDHPKHANVSGSGNNMVFMAPRTADTKHITQLVEGQRRSKSKPKKMPNRLRSNSNWAPPSIQKPPFRYQSNGRNYYNKNNSFKSFPNKNMKKPLLPIPASSNIPKTSLPFVPTRKSPPLTKTFSTVPVKKMQNTFQPQTVPQKPLRIETPNSKYVDPPVTPKFTYKQQLERKAEDLNLSLFFHCITAGKIKCYCIGSVKVGNKTFSSYPLEPHTEQDAYEEASKKALEDLKQRGSSTSCPETRDFNLVCDRVKQLLEVESQGLWLKHLKIRYNNKFTENLPDSWIRDAEHTVNFIKFMRPVPEGDYILQYCPEEVLENLHSPPPLEFPEDSQWPLHVTYVGSCSDISVRLLGENYHAAYDSLVTEMELHYMEKKNQKVPTTFEVDKFYAHSSDNTWFRVQLCELEGNSATVNFIDHGDDEIVDVSSLCELEPKFMKLAAQSFSICLTGLEFCRDNEYIVRTLQSMALAKNLIGQLYSKDGDTMSMVLYDTSDAEKDVNINEKLLQGLPEIYVDPKLPAEGGVCEVYISHVSNSGDITVYIESATYKILESFLHLVKKRALDILGDENAAIEPERIYLAKFAYDGEWHRGSPRSNIKDTPGKALVCRLANVPDEPDLIWSRKVSERLLSLIPGTDPLLLKVIHKNNNEYTVPSVELFKRVEPKNELVSLNFTLSMEKSLFSKRDDIGSSATNRINGISEFNPFSTKEALAKHKLPQIDIPELNDYFDVVVAFVANPSNLVVQPFVYKKDLHSLIQKMNECYSCESNLEDPGTIEVGGYYAALHPDGSWYRVCITHVNENIVMGVYIDYSEYFHATTRNIQPLWPRFRKLPCQGIKAKLYGISPKSHDWSPEDCSFLHNLVSDKDFVSVVMSVDKTESEPLIEIKLIDTSDPRVDTFIDRILVNKGIAVENV